MGLCRSNYELEHTCFNLSSWAELSSSCERSILRTAFGHFRIWRCNTISFTGKFKLYKSHVASILLYGVKRGPCLLTLKKGSKLSKLSARGNFSESPSWSTSPVTGCGTRATSLWVRRNLLWQLSRDGNLHGSGMSHATTAVSYTHLTLPTNAEV